MLHRVVLMVGDAGRRRTDDSGGLTYSQLRLLGAVEDLEPATQHRLAQATAVSDPAISRALKPLEAAGYVRVVTDPDHRRRRLVTLTEAGRAVFHDSGKPLVEELRVYLVQAGFPYERYLEDTTRLAELLKAT